MKRLYRDRWNKKIAGVCGGFGQFLKIDPTIIRLAFILLTIFTFVLPMAVIYFLAWILMPEGPKLMVEPTYPQLYRSRKNRKLGGICGGIAKLTKIDATVIRISLVLACIITGFVPIIVGYIIGLLIIPEEPLYHSPK